MARAKSGLAFVITAIAAGRLGATRASATAYFVPVVALLLGVAVRGEQVAALSVVGSAVLLAGAWVMRRASENRVAPIRAGGEPDAAAAVSR